MYSPRCRRAGVASNRRSVNARFFGPMIGRQPIVKVMPTATRAMRTRRLVSRAFCQRLIYSDPRFIQVSTSSIVRGTLAESRSSPVGVSRYESSMRTPMFLYFSTIGRTFAMKA